MNNISEKNYLSSKDAGAILGYTHDYISRLCRQGKMSGLQKGREWFVTMEEIELFKMRHEVELAQKKKELSKKFSQIRRDAEAKKRKAKEGAKLSTIQSSTSQDTPKHKKITFTIPRQIVATFALLLCISLPTIVTTFNTSYSIQDITDTVDQGIQDMIYTQSTVVEPAASFFAFVPHLTDGYFEYFNRIGQLPYLSYISWYKVGQVYLTLYLLQGQALYSSAQDLNTIGAIVLGGYELVGESFVYGSRDILERYSRMLNLEEKLDTSSNSAKVFTAQVSGGAQYASDSVKENIFVQNTSSLSKTVSMFKNNVSANISSIAHTLSSISNGVNKTVGSLFEFNLVKKEEKIRAIKLQE